MRAQPLHEGQANMQTLMVTDPCDRQNPSEELSKTIPVMYHGTHSMFCTRIERQGFCFDSFEAMHGKELRTIVAACDDLHLELDGYACAKGFSTASWVYFSASFRAARGYALNAGCERIDGALRAANAFLAVARDKRHVERLVAHWEEILKKHGPHAATERVLANLRNVDLVRRLAEQVANAQVALKAVTSQGHPVIYVVRADEKWLQDCHVNALGETVGDTRLLTVAADRIVARIEYTNGISPETE